MKDEGGAGCMEELDFNTQVLKAAHEAIPRGARKEYKPYTSNQLQELQDEMEESRKEAEHTPCHGAQVTLMQSKVKFINAKFQAIPRARLHYKGDAYPLRLHSN